VHKVPYFHFIQGCGGEEVLFELLLFYALYGKASITFRLLYPSRKGPDLPLMYGAECHTSLLY